MEPSFGDPMARINPYTVRKDTVTASSNVKFPQVRIPLGGGVLLDTVSFMTTAVPQSCEFQHGSA